MSKDNMVLVEVACGGWEANTDIPDPVSVERFLGGLSVVWKFDNGYGASVCNGSGNYGVELAVLDADGNLCYDTPVTSDVIGWISSVGELRGYLRQIMALPVDNG